MRQWIDVPNTDGQTALMEAIVHGPLDVVSMLVFAGADLGNMDAAIDLANENARYDVALFLEAYQANPGTVIMDAIRDKDFFKIILEFMKIHS